jgi:hypothetical protein
MFTLILLNCVSMALENPYVRPGSPMDKALFWSNVSFTIVFTVEALVKVFAYTFVAYIKRITNQVRGCRGPPWGEGATERARGCADPQEGRNPRNRQGPAVLFVRPWSRAPPPPWLLLLTTWISDFADRICDLGRGILGL